MGHVLVLPYSIIMVNKEVQQPLLKKKKTQWLGDETVSSVWGFVILPGEPLRPAEVLTQGLGNLERVEREMIDCGLKTTNSGKGCNSP